MNALPLTELWIGEMRGCMIAGRPVLLLRVEDGVYAYADRCAHLGVRLSEGTLQDGVLTCGAHGFQYDARTGLGINPRQVCIAALPLRIEDGHIWVEPDRDGGRSA